VVSAILHKDSDLFYIKKPAVFLYLRIARPDRMVPLLLSLLLSGLTSLVNPFGAGRPGFIFTDEIWVKYISLS
jgi:hypothetical protein